MRGIFETGFSILSKRRTDVPFRDRVKCTVAEAESFGGVGNTTIWNWINSGRVKSTKIGGKRLIDVPSFLAVLDGAEQQQTA
jgi:hypothetical protein